MSEHYDIVKIKEQVKQGYIGFYVKDKTIYCKNDTGEVVAVGEVEQ